MHLHATKISTETNVWMTTYVHQKRFLKLPVPWPLTTVHTSTHSTPASSYHCQNTTDSTVGSGGRRGRIPEWSGLQSTMHCLPHIRSRRAFLTQTPTRGCALYSPRIDHCSTSTVCTVNQGIPAEKRAYHATESSTAIPWLPTLGIEQRQSAMKLRMKVTLKKGDNSTAHISFINP